jgi:hypothetical protein
MAGPRNPSGGGFAALEKRLAGTRKNKPFKPAPKKVPATSGMGEQMGNKVKM